MSVQISAFKPSINHSIYYFLSSCEKYANDLLALARSEEAQDALVFVVTASGTRKAVLSNHNDIATTIAYTIALHDPVYRIEGIKNDDYFQAIKSALVAKSDQAVHMVAKKVLRVDFKTKSVLDKVPSPNQQFAGNVSASKSDEPEDLMQVVQVEGIETNANTPEPIYQGVDDDDRSSGDSEEKVSYGSDVVMDTSKLPPGILFPHGLPSKAHLKCLLDAGLSSDILDDISTCCCISGAGSAKRKGKIVDAVDKLVIDRYFCCRKRAVVFD
ncbi:hypothetical protein EON65_03555 [archaeon]|nr:MAG: hypothetical protein EON65_03555 [archaeon]